MVQQGVWGLPIDHVSSAGDFRWEYGACAASFIELRDLRLGSGWSTSFTSCSASSRSVRRVWEELVFAEGSAVGRSSWKIRRLEVTGYGFVESEDVGSKIRGYDQRRKGERASRS